MQMKVQVEQKIITTHHISESDKYNQKKTFYNLNVIKVSCECVIAVWVKLDGIDFSKHYPNHKMLVVYTRGALRIDLKQQILSMGQKHTQPRIVPNFYQQKRRTS